MATHDPSVNHINSIEELPKHFFSELRNYFEQYKVLENKQVQIEDFQTKDVAYRIILDSVELYKQKFA